MKYPVRKTRKKHRRKSKTNRMDEALLRRQALRPASLGNDLDTRLLKKLMVRSDIRLKKNISSEKYTNNPKLDELVKLLKKRKAKNNNKDAE